MIPRYSRNKLKEIWDPHNKFSIWLQIELLICEAQQKLGNIPKKSLDNIIKYSSFDIKRIDEIEKVMVIAKDVTDLEHLQQEVEQKEEENKFELCTFFFFFFSLQFLILR